MKQAAMAERGRRVPVKPSGSTLEQLVYTFLTQTENGWLVMTNRQGKTVEAEKREVFSLTVECRVNAQKADRSLKQALDWQQRIFQELQRLEHGQLLVRLQDSRLVLLERSEVLPAGMAGDGI